MTVMRASCPFRHGVRSAERKRFFASCCEMVEAPITTLPSRRFFSIAFSMASQSKPSWSTKRASSAATIARFRWLEIRS
jgi:hypothetical protein